VAGHGLFEDQKPNERPFLSVEEGVYGKLFLYMCCHIILSTRFSVLPAISLTSGILHCSIVEGSFCTETFSQFIEGLLDKMEPYPSANSVVVMDNCQIHKHPDILAMIEARSVFHSIMVFVSKLMS
jgi:hypothetical protein